MNIHLPVDMESRLRERAKSCGFETIEEFVVCLVEAELLSGTPVELSRDDQERLNRLVEEGVESGFEPLTPADFQNIRDRLTQRLNESEGNKP